MAGDEEQCFSYEAIFVCFGLNIYHAPGTSQKRMNHVLWSLAGFGIPEGVA